jgi:hypothetical protein
MTLDDDRDRQQFAQARRLDAQEHQHTQNTKGCTSLAHQPAVMPVGAVNILKARKCQKRFRRQRPEARRGHALNRAQHPERNLCRIQHPHPGGVPVATLLLLRVKVTDAFR